MRPVNPSWPMIYHLEGDSEETSLFFRSLKKIPIRNQKRLLGVFPKILLTGWQVLHLNELMCLRKYKKGKSNAITKSTEN